jgi:hypothetical protein
MTTTTLSNLITRMNVYTPIFAMDEVRKVNAIDQAIRMFRVNNQPPWSLKKTTLRVFQDVYEYPTASDHAQLAFLSNQNLNRSFGEQPRYVFTSLKDFVEDPTYRNLMAEIWQNGTRYLGVRDKTNTGYTSTLLDSAESVTNWSASGDAGTPVLDTVVFITGNASIRVPITNSSNTATISSTFTAFTDTNYARKYFFLWVYLDGAPSSVTLRVGTSASQYLSAAVTTQFSGAAFATDDWNLLAIDLNTATNTGSFAGVFSYQAAVLSNAPTGTYYFDASYARGWKLQDYWYYTTYNVLSGSTYSDYFAADGATYSLSAVLMGDTGWHDAIVYEACTYLLSDQKETQIFRDVSELRNMAWSKFFGRYPDMSPHIITDVYRFETDYQNSMGWPDLTTLG